MNQNTPEIIYGHHAVFHLIAAGRRRALRLHLQKGSEREASGLIPIAREKGIPVAFEEASFFTKRVGAESSHHQGVLVETEAYPYVALESLLNSSVVLILDELQDPQNLGALCRTGHQLGVEGVILPETRSASIGAGTCRASAGAVEYLKIARVSSVAKTLPLLKQNQFWIYGASPKGTKDLYEERFSEKVALVIGGEEKGMRRLVQERCDLLLKIPMAGCEIGSFNASVSGAIILAEIFRQRRKN